MDIDEAFILFLIIKTDKQEVPSEQEKLIIRKILLTNLIRRQLQKLN